MNLYTYYDQVPEIDAEDSLRLILLWQQRWTAAGLFPVVLNQWQARKHPLFAEFAAAIEKLPSVNPARYETACWYRWLALATVGGGWMSDYDVMPAANFSIDAIPREPKKFNIYQTPCCPSFVLAEDPLQLCLEVIKAAGTKGNRPHGDKPHYSDMYFVEDLHMARVDWVVTHNVMKLWSDVGWEKAPLLHFANAVLQPKKMLPRWKHIPPILNALPIEIAPLNL